MIDERQSDRIRKKRDTPMGDGGHARALVFVVLAGELVEEADLSEHGPNASHLEHQPLEGLVEVRRILRHEPLRLLGQVDQDRTGLEQRQRLGAAAATVDAFELDADNANVSIAGSGDAKLTAHKALTVSIARAGDVTASLPRLRQRQRHAPMRAVPCDRQRLLCLGTSYGPMGCTGNLQNMA
jgi:Putative auto-transporter adhesin, head GIN domain